MFSFFKNSLLILSFCVAVPVHSQTEEKSQFLEFVNDDALYNGAMLSALSYGLSHYMTKLVFMQYNIIGTQQEKDAQKENATDQVKRIGKVIQEIKETLKKNKGKEPLFVACIANYPGPIATIKKGNDYGIILGGGTPDLLFGLRENAKAGSQKAREFFINHEYSHFKHNDTKKRHIFGAMGPLFIALAWRTMRFSGSNKLTAGTASIITALIHSYLTGIHSQKHEIRADLEASQDPEILKAGASWVEKTWDPFEIEASKKNIETICKDLQLPFSEENVLKFFQFFKTHPTNAYRAQYLREHAAQIEAKQLKKRQAL